MPQQTDIVTWGLRSDITPSLGARLVQERNTLHYLDDRACLVGTFTPVQQRALSRTFPRFIKDMEAALRTGKLNPREPRRFIVTRNGLTCESDTNGSFGYVYLTIYPEKAATPQ